MRMRNIVYTDAKLILAIISVFSEHEELYPLWGKDSTYVIATDNFFFAEDDENLLCTTPIIDFIAEYFSEEHFGTFIVTMLAEDYKSIDKKEYAALASLPMTSSALTESIRFEDVDEFKAYVDSLTHQYREV